MKNLGKFPGRHLATRIGSAKAELDRYVDRWEQDQRVSRVVVVLKFDRGLTYEEISKFLRSGPGYCHRTPDQVRHIVRSAKKEADALIGVLSAG